VSSVTLANVHKAFGSTRIVKGVDLEVRSGEFLVMVGPSGCGKTTLLRLIAGLESPDMGDLLIDGVRVTDTPPRDRDVAMVFQSYALYPHMTVRENMAFGLELRKLPRKDIQSRVEEAAAQLELSKLLDRKPKELSGGQRQRVAMGRALVRRPKIFLFDEPLSNLDTALRVQMRGELARLHRKLGATMIYVTHDQVEAMTLATRVAVFNGGKLQQVGAPLELYNAPTNHFVATFLGSPSMNFLSAVREGELLKGPGFQLRCPVDLGDVREVKVGLRPQDLRVQADGEFTGTVEAVERLGSDGYAFLATPAGPLVSRFDRGTQVSVGETVKVCLLSNALHVFSADGEAAILHPGDARPRVEVVA
jgi:ABC-type sugar transport system ATPase subunit